MDQPLLLKFFTTARLGRAELSKFVSETKWLLGADRLAGQCLLEAEREVRSFGDISEFIASISFDWTGCLTVVFGDDNGAAVRCDLLRLKRRKGRAGRIAGADAAYRTHEITIELPADIRGDAGRCARIEEYFVRVAELLSAEFGLAQDGTSALERAGLALGLESGLPGIFRATAIGASFVSLIGRDRLMALPVREARPFGNHGVIIRLDENLCSEPIAALDASSESIRREIGPQYFAKSESMQLDVGPGQIGLFAFAKAIINLRRAHESEENLASIRPSLDWTGVFAD